MTGTSTKNKSHCRNGGQDCRSQSEAPAKAGHQEPSPGPALKGLETEWIF